MPCQPGALWVTRDAKGREAQALGQAHYMNLLKRIDSPLNKGVDGHFDLEPGSLPLRIMTLDELYEELPGMCDKYRFMPLLTPALDLPSEPQPAVVSHDGEVLVYATSESVKTKEAQLLCVSYEPVPFPSKTGDGAQKLPNKRKHNVVGAGSQQAPIHVDVADRTSLSPTPPALHADRDLHIVAPPSRQPLPPAAPSKPTPIPRASTVNRSRRRPKEDDIPQEFSTTAHDDYFIQDGTPFRSCPALPSHLHSGPITALPSKRRKLTSRAVSPEDNLDPPHRRPIGPLHRGVKRKITVDDAPPSLLPGAATSRQPPRPSHHRPRSPLSTGQAPRSRQASNEQRNVQQDSRRALDRHHVPVDRAPGYRYRDPALDDECPLAPLPRQRQGYMRPGSRAPHDVEAHVRGGSRVPSDVPGYMCGGSRAPSDALGYMSRSHLCGHPCSIRSLTC